MEVQEGVVGKEKLQWWLTGLKASIHHAITLLEKHSVRWDDQVTDWWCDLHVNVFSVKFAFSYSTVFSIFVTRMYKCWCAHNSIYRSKQPWTDLITTLTMLYFMLSTEGCTIKCDCKKSFPELSSVLHWLDKKKVMRTENLHKKSDLSQQTSKQPKTQNTHR